MNDDHLRSASTKSKPPRLLASLVKIVVISAVAAYLAGGFVAGAVWCDPGDSLLANIIGRPLVGGLFCFLSATSFGYPQIDTAGFNRLDAWPYIYGCWAVFLVVGVFLLIIRYNRNNAHPTSDDVTDV